ncbi:hypothetical protein FSP39_010028 [Pinctada imbricata]|uniref:EF-hand domain-containing protein n=1 Tax=Pinctada imbricata TaxID=66713 RepID=A0AA88XU58_PINIB|nr:hypothetical protein FSP39_010028 [Pinctada imbricata]
MGRSVSEDKLMQIMEKADVSGTGTLSYDEYVKFINDNTVDINLLRVQLQEAFMKYDKTRTGDLNIEEMKQALASVGQPLSEKEIRDLMEQADANQDGKIDVNG